MAACKEELIVEDKASYVREKYLKLQREKEQYVSLDDYCAKRNIDQEFTRFFGFSQFCASASSHNVFKLWNLGLAYEKAGDLKQAVDLTQISVEFERGLSHVDAEKHAEYLENLRARIEKK